MGKKFGNSTSRFRGVILHVYECESMAGIRVLSRMLNVIQSVCFELMKVTFGDVIDGKRFRGGLMQTSVSKEYPVHMC